MKRIWLLLLCTPLIFLSCKKDDDSEDMQEEIIILEDPIIELFAGGQLLHQFDDIRTSRVDTDNETSTTNFIDIEGWQTNGPTTMAMQLTDLSETIDAFAVGQIIPIAEAPEEVRASFFFFENGVITGLGNGSFSIITYEFVDIGLPGDHVLFSANFNGEANGVQYTGTLRNLILECRECEGGL
ncbi:hypothetical protein POV27_14440 [Aureisphaera galaxeae]|uniref:hypothetical protein n=1 Tax=Aureisphaera galaxeae TaxID=1538023 RepID=UPI00234FE74B|nr:hypothetical protein [Aureisphaera galaxeae]MDC8005257.1 hypothetical protein [Aureisphaera galaxeae]